MDLKKTKDRVKAILEEIPETRNSDNILYREVCKQIAKEVGEDLHHIDVLSFFSVLHKSAYPCFESVRRTRQKLQADFPHLSASVEIQLYRAENEAVYEQFAIGR